MALYTFRIKSLVKTYGFGDLYDEHTDGTLRAVYYVG